MSEVDFWKLWGWKEAPFFGELTMHPEKSHLFVEREELLERAHQQLVRQ